ncbi:MAG: ribonuclease M5 [Bacilli bacterium]|nr:ribonuclease M5 [Bacilli bacterium]
MTKQDYPAIIVVEGASDKALLTSFLNAEIVITNGSDVPRETIDYLKEAKKTRDIVVLTDPDSPGKRIRDVLDQEIPGLLHAFVPKEKCIKRHKVGIAESSPADVLEALSHLVPASKEATPNHFVYADLFELGLIGQEDSAALRDRICHRYHLGMCNGKTLLRRLNALGITKEQLQEAIYG